VQTPPLAQADWHTAANHGKCFQQYHCSVENANQESGKGIGMIDLQENIEHITNSQTTGAVSDEDVDTSVKTTHKEIVET
jgi:hypothetical protein